MNDPEEHGNLGPMTIPRSREPRGGRKQGGGRPPVLDSGPQRRELSAHLVEELTLARLRTGLTVRQLADLSGISKSMISAVCRGNRVPSRDVADELSAALRLDLEAAEALMAEAVIRGWPD